MGLDGGTIITRNDVLRRSCDDLNRNDTSRSSRGGAVRGTFKRKQLDDRTSKVTRWSTCALSGQPLAAPIVACFLGRLYNKAAVLELLLARAGHFEDEAAEHRYLNQLRTAAGAFDHITSSNDVFALLLSPADAASPAGPAPAVAASTADGGVDPELPAPFTCPITSLRCDTKHPFVALRPCGHVFSERAVREAAGDGTCPTCGAKFAAEEDVVPLMPSEEQLERLREQLPARRKRQKEEQRQRKKQRRAGGGGEEAAEQAGGGGTVAASNAADQASGKRQAGAGGQQQQQEQQQ